jgi:hypothetical protein
MGQKQGPVRNGNTVQEDIAVLHLLYGAQGTAQSERGETKSGR